MSGHGLGVRNPSDSLGTLHGDFIKKQAPTLFSSLTKKFNHSEFFLNE